ncbi:hypothetical protein ACFWOG_08905 [Kitasatospora sp. NPDC058406]|uniref:hypothetical protein n=2 Tax=Kitasatosporales TaxID=85011 RepID=UPI002E7A1954|nr:hypothetical protein [Streptomyces sp. BE20]
MNLRARVSAVALAVATAGLGLVTAGPAAAATCGGTISDWEAVGLVSAFTGDAKLTSMGMYGGSVQNGLATVVVTGTTVTQATPGLKVFTNTTFTPGSFTWSYNNGYGNSSLRLDSPECRTGSSKVFRAHYRYGDFVNTGTAGTIVEGTLSRLL